MAVVHPRCSWIHLSGVPRAMCRLAQVCRRQCGVSWRRPQVARDLRSVFNSTERAEANERLTKLVPAQEIETMEAA
ncbi:MAG TPA: hypothetical protein VMH82_05250 [Myxococcota bacterium]|nr:hypothetical protein [Myxococcota bacterium]